MPAPGWFGGRPAPPPVDLARESWRDRAACRNHPTLRPSTWDDSVMDEQGCYGGEQRTRRIAAAIAVCNHHCPVRMECLRDTNLEWDDGVRGGIDLRDLREAQKRSGKAS